MTQAPRLPPDYELHAYDVVDDVIEEAKRLAASGAEEGTLVWALEQRAGRARLQRHWVSPPGNLYCALLLRLDDPAERAAQTCYVAILSLAAALAELIGPAELRFRWPNDILIGEGKAAGVWLAASPRNAADSFEWLIVGAAANINSHPPDIASAAIAPYSDRYGGVSPADALEGYCRHFLSWINRWAEEGFAAVQKPWLQRANNVGEVAKIALATEALSGTLAGLDEGGAAVLRLSNGATRRIPVTEFFSI